MTIYSITNLVNRKVYIGKTIQDPKLRFKQHKNSARLGKSDQLIHRAINKYGIENFKFEVIFNAFSEDDLSKSEQDFIAQYDCCVLDGSHKGYNMTRGGEGVSGLKHSEESKQKMRKPKSEETKAKLREAWKTRPPHSAETREKQSKSQIGRTDAPETKAKKATKAAREWKVTHPDGTEAIVLNLKEFCVQHSLYYECMKKIAYGYAKTHRGFTCTKM